MSVVLEYLQAADREPPPLFHDPRPLPRVWLVLAAVTMCVLYAALWTPHWYPLSDSALYLNMARAWANGQSYAYVRSMHQGITMMTPLMLGVVIKLGGGIGAMHALMIALTLASNFLCFFTLRRWFNERTAFWATLATAATWWVFYNATVIMTESAFLAFFWGSMLAFSHVRCATVSKQWICVILGCLLLAAAFSNRFATVIVIPGVLAALWLSNLQVPMWRRIGWVMVFVVVFGLLGWEYKHPPKAPRLVVSTTGPTSVVTMTTAAPTPGAEGETIPTATATDTYQMTTLHGISNPVLQLPICGGRWIAEGLAAPSRVLATFPNLAVQIAGAVIFITIFALMLGGWLYLVLQRHWWPVGIMIYFLPPWIMWGTRIKPRYMDPVMPLMFIFVGLGIVWAWQMVHKMLSQRSASGRLTDYSRLWPWLCGTGAVLVLLANLPIYGLELYVRHFDQRNFYDATRSGGFAELVDIAAYVQEHADPREAVGINVGAYRRIITFLSGRPCVLPPRKGGIREMRMDRPPADLAGFNETLRRYKGRYLIMFYDQPAWPEFHLPLRPSNRPNPTWWQLFERNATTGLFEPVNPPKQRDYVDDIPPSMF